MSSISTDLKKIQVYLTEEELKQFKIVSAWNNISMSGMCRKMIQNEIKKLQDKLK